jgi:hypothetical protein
MENSSMCLNTLAPEFDFLDEEVICGDKKDSVEQEVDVEDVDSMVLLLTERLHDACTTLRGVVLNRCKKRCFRDGCKTQEVTKALKFLSSFVVFLVATGASEASKTRATSYSDQKAS